MTPHLTEKTVEYRKLGDSGLRVSVPILGGASIGSSTWLGHVLDEDKGMEVLKAAWDNGVTTIPKTGENCGDFS